MQSEDADENWIGNDRATYSQPCNLWCFYSRDVAFRCLFMGPKRCGRTKWTSPLWVGGRLKSDGVRWRREELAAGKGKAKEGSARRGGRDETLVASSPAPQSPLRHNNACEFASAPSTSWAGNLHIPSKRLHESYNHKWEKIAVHFQWMHPDSFDLNIFP